MAECFADHDGCFEGANSLFNDQELVHIDHEVTIDVHIDASAYGLGRVLMQIGKPDFCVSASLIESPKVFP